MERNATNSDVSPPKRCYTFQQLQILNFMKESFSDTLDPDEIEELLVRTSFDADQCSDALLLASKRTQLEKEEAKRQEAAKAAPLATHLPDVFENSVLPSFDNDTDIKIYGILAYLKFKYRVMVIIRGLPGSGKTTLANVIAAKAQIPFCICSIDDFFISAGGTYEFKKELLQRARSDCSKIAEREVIAEKALIIIDNMNVTKYEMLPYLELAIQYKYHLAIIEPNTPWKYNPIALCTKTTHGVPLAIICKKLRQFEPVNEKLMISSLKYRPSQVRHIPNNIADVNRQLLRKSGRCEPKEEEKGSSSQQFSLGQQVEHALVTEQEETAIIKSRSSDKSDPCSSFKKTDEVDAAETNNCLLSAPSTLDDGMTSHIQGTYSETYKYDAESHSNLMASKCYAVGEMQVATPSERRCKITKVDSVEDMSYMGPVYKSEKAKLEQMAVFFPDFELSVLDAALEFCNGDLDWALNLFLDSPEELQKCADEFQETSGGAMHSSCTTRRKPAAAAHSVVADTDELGFADYSPCISEESSNDTDAKMQLKRKIEESIVLSPSFYSARVLNQKKQHFGGVKKEAANKILLESEENCYADDESTDTCNETSRAGDDEDDDADELVQMRLDKSFGQYLLASFGGPNITQMPGYTDDDLISEIPESIARMIHSYWMQTLQKRFNEREAQMNELLKNDEALALMLETRCDSDDDSAVLEFPDLKTVMREEKRSSPRKTKQADSAAARFSRQRLLERFSKLDPKAVNAVFDANNKNYQDAEEAILASFGDDDHEVVTVMSPEAEQALARAKELNKEVQMDAEDSILASESREVRDAALIASKKYRSAAAALNMRMFECMQAARVALNSQDIATAQKLHEKMLQLKAQCDLNNNLAANCLFGSARKNTLDLHFLFMKEALEVLDVFLDLQKEQLLQSGKKQGYVLVITGRGAHSENGTARIKPAVIRRIRERNLRYEECNPGCLKVFVNDRMLLSVP